MSKFFCFSLFVLFLNLFACQSPKQENAEKEAAELVDELIKSGTDTSSSQANDNIEKK